MCSCIGLYIWGDTLLRPSTQAGETDMAIKTIEELFVKELSDIYSAEKQLSRALPK